MMAVPQRRALSRRGIWFLAIAGAAALVSACISQSAAIDDPSQRVAFEDVTIEAGLSYENFSCIVFDDFDNDGDPDLVLGPISDPGTDPGLDVHENTGDGTFQTHHIAPNSTFIAMSCTSGDVDLDGDSDIIVGHAPPALSVLKGHGDFHFAEETDTILDLRPGQGPAYGISAISLLDFDQDGFLDILVGHTSLPSPRTCEFVGQDFRCLPESSLDWSPCLLLRGIDGSSWVPVASPPCDPVSAVHSFGIIDLNRDGWPDVFTTQDFAPNGLFLNHDGSGTFVNVTAAEGVAVYNHGMGSAFADFDRDGWWDIYVADLGPDQLWLGGASQMREAASELGVQEATLYHSGWSPQAQDFNQDGYVDIFVTNSGLVNRADDLVAMSMGTAIANAPNQSDFILTANQDGRYATDLVPHRDSPDAQPRPNGGASAVADYDGDGDLDIAQFYQSPPTFRLLENRTEDVGNWLQVRLEAREGIAYGAEVEAVMAGGIIDRRALHGASGAQGRSWDVLHFGLGETTTVDQFVVWWPGREKQIYPGPFHANQLITLHQN